MRSLTSPPTSIRVLPLALVLGIASCTMEPTYRRPAAPIPSAYPSGPAYSTPGASAVAPNGPAAADLGWRQFFTDPQLQQLIATALANNRDLRIATLKIGEARALYRLQRAAQFPEIDANLGFNSQRLSPGLRAPGQSPVINTYTAGVGLTNFELDVFGRVRSLSHAAQEQYLATKDARRSVHISLVAEVGDAYLTLMADRALLELARDTLKNQQDAARMIQRGNIAGGMAQIDAHRADTQVQTAQVAVEQYMRQVAQDQNALTLLVGAPLPSSVANAPPLGNQPLLAEFPVGLPSSLLERRPDIMAAEHQLIAANANIGAARAAFFPRISLTGLLGVASASLAGLFSGGGAWLFAPQLTMPIFNAGRNQASLDLATVQRDENVANYERTIQVAFREVADSMAARATYKREVSAQEKMIHDLTETKRLAEMRFQNGVDGDYFAVFDAQRQLFASQQLLVTYKLAALTSRVMLYRALGGGWVESGPAAQALPRSGPAAQAAPASRSGSTVQSSVIAQPQPAVRASATGQSGPVQSSAVNQQAVTAQPGAATRPSQATQSTGGTAAPVVTTVRRTDASGVTETVETTITHGTPGHAAHPSP